MSPGTRLLASEMKATKRPSALSAGGPRNHASRFPCMPSLATLTRSVIPVCRSRTNTSSALLLSPGTRLEADDLKATKRPSALSAGP